MNEHANCCQGWPAPNVRIEADLHFLCASSGCCCEIDRFDVGEDE